MNKLLFILPCLAIMFQPLKAEVKNPTNQFDLDELNFFFPGKSMSEIDSKFGKGEFLSDEKGMRTFKYFINNPKYKIVVLVQFKDNEAQDFLARLPSYFLHDVFFQSLINRLGKQNFYKKIHEEAFYTWNSLPLKHVYSASCTITCFPVFYSVLKKDSEKESILSKMHKANFP